MDEQGTPVGGTVEMEEQILAASLDALDACAAKRRREVGRKRPP
jgi:hypothetical protein